MPEPRTIGSYIQFLFFSPLLCILPIRTQWWSSLLSSPGGWKHWEQKQAWANISPHKPRALPPGPWRRHPASGGALQVVCKGLQVSFSKSVCLRSHLHLSRFSYGKKLKTLLFGTVLSPEWVGNHRKIYTSKLRTLRENWINEWNIYLCF